MAEWLDEEAIFAEAVRPLPLEAFHLPKLQRGYLVVEIRQRPWSVSGRWHVIKLRWAGRRAAGDCDLTFRPNDRVDPVVISGTYSAQGQFAGLAFERLQPHGNLGCRNQFRCYSII